MISEQRWHEITGAAPAKTLEAALEKTFWLCAGRFGAGALVPETWEQMALAARTFLENETL